jgi:acetyl-CoA synthetase
MELESSLVRHEAVAEAAVIGTPDELTGQAVVAFVTLKQGISHDHNGLANELRAWVAKEIGSFAKPKEIRFAEALPKTRSGKIMRRLLRELATTNHISGDVTTLEDFNVVNKLASKDED